MTAAELFLKCLQEQGVTVIFGLPGEENSDFMIALLDSPIQFVTCRHELTASFMADAYGRLTGRPGVCLSTLGPGSTNLITGVANANMDNAPLIAIIGQAATDKLHKESHQNMDSVAMYTPVTKWATSIRDPETIPEIIYKAFKIAVADRPGAVLIELPEDIAKKQVSKGPLLSPTNPEPCHSYQCVDAALKFITNAKAPLLLVGPGCAEIDCDAEVTTFIKKTHVYGVTTFMAKGVISDDNPHSLFTVGFNMKDIAIEAFYHADLVICIGYRMIEWSPYQWNIGIKKKIIHIDAARAEVDEKYLPDLQLIGDVKGILNEVNQRLETTDKNDNELYANIRANIIADHSLETKSNAFPIKPQRNLHDLRQLMHKRDILFSDVGAHKMWVARQYLTYHSQTCFIYNGFCSMGGAIPGATVAKWLHPEKTVVALCGDGGFMMSLASLATAVEYFCPIIVIIWNDNSYGLIKWKQEQFYQKYSHVDLVNPDFVSLARSFGCHATSINHPDEFAPAFRAAQINSDAPSVIVVPIDYSENMKLTMRLKKIIQD